MKILHIIFITLLFIAPIKAQTLHGRITDSADGKPIAGALIFIPRLNLTSVSDTSGNYRLSPVPRGACLVEAEMLGYAAITRQIWMKGDVTANFSLAASASNQREVVITAFGNAANNKNCPVPVVIVPHEALMHENFSNAIDAIALQPGVAACSYGPGIGKPEVNGLGVYRVVTVFDGVPQEDFQFGTEHNVMINPYAIYDAQIIRGPASLQYGSGAMGGVIDFRTSPFPENGVTEGSITTDYQTNNGQAGESLNLTGNNRGIVWGFTASGMAAHCYNNPVNGYVWGTAYNNYNVRAVAGIEKKWGYSRLSFSTYRQMNGIAEGTRDSLAGKFAYDMNDNNFIGGKEYPTQTDYLSYNPCNVLFQQIEHNVLSWQNGINIGKGLLLADVAYTSDHRAVFDTGTVARLNMWLTDVPYSLKYEITDAATGINLQAGINGFYEYMRNNNEAPAPYYSKFIIPDYSFLDAGAFAIVQKSFGKLTLCGGLRYDTRNQTADGMYDVHNKTASQALVPEGTTGANQLFAPAAQSFGGTSASLGGTYSLPGNNYLKLNVAKSYRAPSIPELEENRVDPSLNEYVIGDGKLKAEGGYEADLVFGSNGRNFDLEADGFFNYIKNFIFSAILPSLKSPGNDSVHYINTNGVNVPYPTFKYEAATAEISGVSGYFNIHPAAAQWLEEDNGLTLIYSYLPGQTPLTEHVPQTPAPRLTSQVKLKMRNRPNSIISNSFLSFGLEKDWAQNNIYGAAFTELPSAAYILYNAGIGTDLRNPRKNKTVCAFFINIMNLTNVAYIDHLSYLQYNYLAVLTASENAALGRAAKPTQIPVQVTQPGMGIYDMGRNIGFRLIFPIGGGKANNL